MILHYWWWWLEIYDLGKTLLLLEGFFNHLNHVVKKAMESIEEFKIFNASPQGVNERTPSQKWTMPIVGHVKINLNATMDKAKRKMGIGVIV